MNGDNDFEFSNLLGKWSKKDSTARPVKQKKSEANPQDDVDRETQSTIAAKSSAPSFKSNGSGAAAATDTTTSSTDKGTAKERRTLSKGKVKTMNSPKPSPRPKAKVGSLGKMFESLGAQKVEVTKVPMKDAPPKRTSSSSDETPVAETSIEELNSPDPEHKGSASVGSTGKRGSLGNKSKNVDQQDLKVTLGFNGMPIRVPLKDAPPKEKNKSCGSVASLSTAASLGSDWSVGSAETPFSGAKGIANSASASKTKRRGLDDQIKMFDCPIPTSIQTVHGVVSRVPIKDVSSKPKRRSHGNDGGGVSVSSAGSVSSYGSASAFETPASKTKDSIAIDSSTPQHEDTSQSPLSPLRRCKSGIESKASPSLRRTKSSSEMQGENQKSTLTPRRTKRGGLDNHIKMFDSRPSASGTRKKVPLKDPSPQQNKKNAIQPRRRSSNASVASAASDCSIDTTDTPVAVARAKFANFPSLPELLSPTKSIKDTLAEHHQEYGSSKSLESPVKRVDSSRSLGSQRSLGSFLKPPIPVSPSVQGQKVTLRIGSNPTDTEQLRTRKSTKGSVEASQQSPWPSSNKKKGKRTGLSDQIKLFDSPKPPTTNIGKMKKVPLMRQLSNGSVSSIVSDCSMDSLDTTPMSKPKINIASNLVAFPAPSKPIRGSLADHMRRFDSSQPFESPANRNEPSISSGKRQSLENEEKTSTPFSPTDVEESPIESSSRGLGVRRTKSSSEVDSPDAASPGEKVKQRPSFKQLTRGSVSIAVKRFNLEGHKPKWRKSEIVSPMIGQKRETSSDRRPLDEENFDDDSSLSSNSDASSSRKSEDKLESLRSAMDTKSTRQSTLPSLSAEDEGGDVARTPAENLKRGSVSIAVKRFNLEGHKPKWQKSDVVQDAVNRSKCRKPGSLSNTSAVEMPVPHELDEGEASADGDKSLDSCSISDVEDEVEVSKKTDLQRPNVPSTLASPRVSASDVDNSGATNLSPKTPIDTLRRGSVSIAVKRFNLEGHKPKWRKSEMNPNVSPWAQRKKTGSVSDLSSPKEHLTSDDDDCSISDVEEVVERKEKEGSSSRLRVSFSDLEQSGTSEASKTIKKVAKDVMDAKSNAAPKSPKSPKKQNLQVKNEMSSFPKDRRNGERPKEVKREIRRQKSLRNHLKRVESRRMNSRKSVTRTTNVRGSHCDSAPESFVLPVFEKEIYENIAIYKALEKNFLFADLTPFDFKVFIQAFEKLEVGKGDAIIEQGDKGDYFYVIADGEVTFDVNGTTVGSASDGKSFGELALLYKAPRAASVFSASKNTVLYRVDSKTFRYIMQAQSKKAEEEKINLLKGVSFLKGLVESDLERLASVMTPRKFKKGDRIVRKGEVGDAFYILKEGEMQATNISVGTTRYEDVTFRPGAHFGERALITSEPRAADVSGRTPGTVFCIDRETFEKVLGDFSRVIMKSQDKVKLEGMAVLKVAELDSGKYDTLAALLVDKTFKANETLFEEGEATEPALYLVREGQVRLAAGDGSSEVIDAGGYFGDDQFLAGIREIGDSFATVPANWTATALGKCICAVLTLDDCSTVFDTARLLGVAEGVGKRRSSAYDLRWSGMSKKSPSFKVRDSLRSSIVDETSFESLERKSILGEGQFGEVWLVSAECENEAERFALKVQSKDAIDDCETVPMDVLKREVDILRMLDHQFIVDLIHHYETEDSFYMVLNYLCGGELWAVIHREGEDGNWVSGIPEENAKFYAYVMADTLAYIHSENVVFRDLKPENVVIDEVGYPIIVDFGFAKVCEKTYTFCGTPNYLAPEIVQNRGHGVGVDHWALGVLIYEMLCGENPFYFEGMDQLALYEAICEEDYFPLPDNTSQEVNELIAHLLEKDAMQRLGMLVGREKDILQHCWFNDLSLAQLRRKEIPAPWIPDKEH